jgi:hypothetical protein
MDKFNKDFLEEVKKKIRATRKDYNQQIKDVKAEYKIVIDAIEYKEFLQKYKRNRKYPRKVYKQQIKEINAECERNIKPIEEKKDILSPWYLEIKRSMRHLEPFCNIEDYMDLDIKEFMSELDDWFYNGEDEDVFWGVCREIYQDDVFCI